MYVHMYVYAYTCICIYIYICVCVCIHHCDWEDVMTIEDHCKLSLLTFLHQPVLLQSQSIPGFRAIPPGACSCFVSPSGWCGGPAWDGVIAAFHSDRTLPVKPILCIAMQKLRKLHNSPLCVPDQHKPGLFFWPIWAPGSLFRTGAIPI